MKAIIFPAIAIALLAALPEPAPAQTSPSARTVYARNWGPLHNGRWIYGWRAPGGWGGYRRAVRGWILPGYWMAPRYHVGDHQRYGWPAPPQGYGWSRYYDDAVLTDPNGVVHETRRDVDWGSYDEYRESRPELVEGYGAPPSRNAKGELVGAVAGGAVGALAGSAIAGKGDRLPGAIVGGAVGAVAGAAVGGASERRGERFLGERRRRNVGPDGAYDGRWSGSWRGSHDGGREHVYTGSFEGEYRGSSPHWRNHGGPSQGYGEIETRTTYQPVTTTTVTETEEWVPAGSE